LIEILGQLSYNLGAMSKALQILAVVFTVLFWSNSSLACDDGDIKVGPHCTHEEWVKLGVLKQLYTTVYSEADGSILWDDFGAVDSCTSKTLKVTDRFGEPQVYHWDPKSRTYI